MELTLYKKNDHWLIYEKKDKTKIPRGKIENLPLLNHFKVHFDGEEQLIIKLTERKSLSIYKFSTSKNNFKGIKTVSPSQNKLVWKVSGSLTEQFLLKQKFDSVTCFYGERRIASLKKKHENYLLLHSNGDGNMKSIVLLSSIVPFIF